MLERDIADCRAAIAALESQRATLGDAVLELATAPLRARLAALLRPAGLQKRQVTVLFADVVGSTALAQGLDAEDTLSLLSSALQRMAALVEAQGGRVLRFTGDGVKAAFGMDEAREDDPERAVRAGLAILQAGREQADVALRLHGMADYAVRVGVHTGDVALGAGVEDDNTAMGAAVHIAARMEQSAPPGALRISHDTWSHVRGLFDADVQPPLQVKGVDVPMQTYLVRAARDRLGAGVERGVQGLRTPLVGRQTELQRLLYAVARAGQLRQLQCLTLVGDAGLGKSRLLRELTDQLTAEWTDLTLLNVRTRPDGLLRPWGVLRSLLALHCGVADTDSVEQAQQKVVDGLSPWFDAGAHRQAQLLGQLAGLDFGRSPHIHGLDPRSLHDLGLAALVAFLKGLAARGQGLVLLVEDLHWADDSSLDMLAHLQARADELPLTLLMTARPALLTRRPGWATAGTLLMLAPLASTQANELVQALLQRMERVPQRLADLIAGQAEGNPYYMEELVRRLLDDGVIVVSGLTWSVPEDRLHNLSLPTTLVGLLQARLDALSAPDRQVARQASVIGHVFWDDALRALEPQATQALDALQRTAFVRTHQNSDFEGTPERQFDHHLLHQVVYNTLLKAERRLGHSAAARWLTEHTQGRGAEFLAMTGEHAERAGEHALAADCFEQAGREAQRRFANTEAVVSFRRALVLLGDAAPARRLALLHEMESIGDTIADRAAQDSLHAEIAALLAHHPDDAGMARLLFCKSLLADRRQDRAASWPLAEQACALGERCGAARWAAVSHGQLAWLTQLQRQYDTARGHIQSGLQWVRQIEDATARAETEGRLLIISSIVSLNGSRADEAYDTLLAVLSLGDTLGSARMRLSAMINLTDCACRLSRYQDMKEWADRSRVLAHSLGALAQEAVAAWSLGDALCLQGERHKSGVWYEHSLALYRRLGDARGVGSLLMTLADSCLEEGDSEGALRWCAQARAQPQAPGELASYRLGTIEGHAQMQLGRLDEARTTAEALLVQLGHGLEGRPDSATILERRACQLILQALEDPRAWPILEQLHADVQATAARVTGAADRDRLLQSNPSYRSIVADYRQRFGP